MSWFLKKKRQIVYLFFIISIIIICSLTIILDSMMYILCYIVCIILAIIVYQINRITRNILWKQSSYFMPNSDIRNVDYLVIGDMYKLPKDLSALKTIQIAVPEIGLDSCFEILKHTHSILVDNGKIIIAVKRKNINKKGYTLFDAYFFHYTTIKLKKLEVLRRKSLMPFIFSPLKSLKFILKCYHDDFYDCGMLSKEMTEFCNRRGYLIQFLCKD